MEVEVLVISCTFSSAFKQAIKSEFEFKFSIESIERERD